MKSENCSMRIFIVLSNLNTLITSITGASISQAALALLLNAINYRYDLWRQNYNLWSIFVEIWSWCCLIKWFVICIRFVIRFDFTRYVTKAKASISPNKCECVYSRAIRCKRKYSWKSLQNKWSKPGLDGGSPAVYAFKWNQQIPSLFPEFFSLLYEMGWLANKKLIKFP